VRDGLGRRRRIDWASPDGSRTATTWEAEYDALGRRTKKVVHRTAPDGTPVRDEWRFSLRSDVITMPDRHDHHRRNAHSGLRVKVTSPPPGPPEGPNSYSPA